MSGKSKIALVVGIVVLVGGAAYVLAGRKPATEAAHPAAKADLPVPVSAPAPAPEAEPVLATTAALSDVAPPEMMEAKSALEAQYAERRKDLPEDVAKPIEDDMGVIEGVAADLLAALASEPDNDDLKRMLVQTYRNEMKLLKKALHLSSEEDAAAPIEPETPAETTN